MSELKHVGRVKATGKKCIVAYRTLPGDAYNCLIIPTENLPDSYHDALINLVESSSGQASYEFAEAMARSHFPDGSIMLAALHTQDRMVKVSTDQIEMLPTNSYAIALSELNQIIAEQRGTTVDELSIKSSIKMAEPATPKQLEELKQEKKEVKVDLESLTDEQRAKHFRSEADRLSKEAASLRRQAEELVPTIKKGKVEPVVEVATTSTKKEKDVSTAKATS